MMPRKKPYPLQEEEDRGEWKSNQMLIFVL